MGRDSDLDALRQFFRLETRFAAAWLFGSRARGEAGPGSDADVAVLRGRLVAGLEGLELPTRDALARLLGCQVDLVVLDEAPPDLAHRVLRDGILLAEQQPSTRVAFEMRTRAEYFDLLPVLHQIRGTPLGLR